MAQQFRDFEEFYPLYVGQHSRRATRFFHFAGTHLGAPTAAVGLVTRRPALLAGFPLISYSVAWFSHFVIEKNNPASFGQPLWSLRGDVRMLTTMWQGRGDELDRIAHAALSPRIAAAATAASGQRETAASSSHVDPVGVS